MVTEHTDLGDDPDFNSLGTTTANFSFKLLYFSDLY